MKDLGVHDVTGKPARHPLHGPVILWTHIRRANSCTEDTTNLKKSAASLSQRNPGSQTFIVRHEKASAISIEISPRTTG